MLTEEQSGLFQFHLEQLYPKGKWEFIMNRYENRRFNRHHEVCKFKNNQLDIWISVGTFFSNPLVHVESSKKQQKQLHHIVSTFFQKQKLDVLLFTLYPSLPFLQETGEKSKNIKRMLEPFGELTFYLDGSMLKRKKRFDFEWHFKIHPFYEALTVFEKRNRNINEVKEFNSSQEIMKYLDDLHTQSARMEEIEQTFLSLIHRYDQTAYLKKEELLYFIYGHSFALYMKQVKTKNGDISYKGRVGMKYVQDKDILKLKDKMEKELTNYLIKNRVRATIAGKSNQFISRFIYHLTDKQTINPSFEKQFDTCLTEGEFNAYLKEHIDHTTKICLSNEQLKTYQKYFKQLGKRHKIKEGYQYGHFIVLISSSKIHLFTEKDIA